MIAYVALYAVAATLMTLGLLIPAIALAVVAHGLAYKREVARVAVRMKPSRPLAEAAVVADPKG